MKWKIGDVTITKITELVIPGFADAIPAATPEFVKKVPWLFPHFVTPEGGLMISIHSLIVETPETKLVVDTCVGNDRNRGEMSPLSNMKTSYLEDLIAVGYDPASIDIVLCTHLHFDHAGWNTRFVDGKWVPTFPKASYLLSQQEMDMLAAIDEESKIDFLQRQRQLYADSIKPVLDAGQVKPVHGPTEVCPGVRLISTPGHSPDHCSVLIESKGEKALITGDCMHHPIQFHNPDLVSPFDMDNATAVTTRHRLFTEFADTPTLIIGTHFAGPTAGKLVRDGKTYRLDV
jgi:glyoxylase-like metal-dependent hydrolase (beta-lactamase superfamily II)